jgi:glycosyltransferase involved in cell wall biosynthesis
MEKENEGILLSVLLPVYNEKFSLLDLLESVRNVDIPKEILLIDDGSTDGTKEIIQQNIEGKFPDIRVFYSDINQGKGSALRMIIPHARGKYAIVQDGDQEYNPEDYHVICKAFDDFKTDVVYGSRFLHGWPKMNPANKIVNKLLAWMTNILYGVSLTDEATCYKAFRTEVLQSIPLRCVRFEFCPEVTAKVLRRGIIIHEVPIRYHARSLLQGKKIRWTDGVSAIWTLIKYRFI